MKFNIAGKWQEKEYIRQIMATLKKMRHEVTCDWTIHDIDSPGYPSAYALEDIEAIKQSPRHETK